MQPMIAPRLLVWWDKHGRKDLPWQRRRTPYRVWVAEIMLQQTRVETVKPYFERFMAAFPSISALANASEDELLAIWAGLGYYSRAHNLLKAARLLAQDHSGELPREFEQLISLPGIGRSTAGAILAQAYGKRRAILDGNARRVLARVHAVHGWPGKAAVNKTLWHLAEANTPSERVRDYTQAIMDLGATVCLRRRPRCLSCPLQDTCKARLSGEIETIPASRPSRHRPLKHSSMLVIQRPDGAVLLCRRPPTGVWAGLWSLPTPGGEESAQAWCARVLDCSPEHLGELPPLQHGFSHFELEIRPIRLGVEEPAGTIQEEGNWLWHDGTQDVGLPAPIRRLLEGIRAQAVTSH